MFIQGAANIFGFETGISFKLTNERIETDLNLNRFNVFKAQVWISAGYGNPFAETGFQAKSIIETGFEELSNKAAQLLINGLQASRKALERARAAVKDAKVTCERNVNNVCDICEKIACDQISEECKRTMDDFKHFISEKVDKFGKCSFQGLWKIEIKIFAKLKHMNIPPLTPTSQRSINFHRLQVLYSIGLKAFRDSVKDIICMVT